MPATTIDRVTLRWGGVNQAGQPIMCGVPLTAIHGGALLAPSDVATMAAMINNAGESYQRITFPPSSGRGEICAISIAPDSAISCCDIALSGDDGEIHRHRISPGNPYVGEVSGSDFALVSIPNAIPLAGLDNETAMIDGELTYSDENGDYYGFPLRLELWRSGFPIRSFRRAPLVANILIDPNVVGLSAPAFHRDIVVPVDGRRRVRIDVLGVLITGGEAANLSVKSVFSGTGETGNRRVDGLYGLPFLPLNNAGDTTVEVGNGGHVFEIEALQSPLIVISLDKAAAFASANPRMHIRVRAED